MSAAEILVIFLSVALALFLALAIVLVIYLIVIAKKIKRVADTAEKTAEHVEGIAALFRKTAAPAAVSSLIMDTLAKFAKRRNKNEKQEEDD